MLVKYIQSNDNASKSEHSCTFNIQNQTKSIIREKKSKKIMGKLKLASFTRKFSKKFLALKIGNVYRTAETGILSIVLCHFAVIEARRTKI